MRDHVVIKYDGKYCRILCEEISPHTEITPGRIKQYIVEKIIPKLNETGVLMAEWEKIRVDRKEWLWNISKNGSITIQDPKKKCYRIHQGVIGPTVTSKKVKDYIFAKLIHAKKKTGPNLIRGEVKYDPRVILPCVMPSSKNKHRMVIDGDLIKVSSDRLYTFKKSLTCAKCGIIGRFLVKEKTPKDRSYHLNLYAEKDGREVLMTKDHIVPKSLGGKDSLDNYQTMCVECNLMKGNET
jgi:hypothetical protein